MPVTELQLFLSLWDDVARRTAALMEALPVDQYDFRPDADGRSLGELAWHLAEIDGYVSFTIERGRAVKGERPPHIERPRTVEQLAPAYRRVHEEAVARLARLQSDDLEREIPYRDGATTRIRTLIWDRLLLHAVHHRAQLGLLCRLAGGTVPDLAGSTREQEAAARARAAAVTAHIHTI